MGYLERDQTVTMKGRVACEVNSGAAPAQCMSPSPCDAAASASCGHPEWAGLAARMIARAACQASAVPLRERGGQAARLAQRDSHREATSGWQPLPAGAPPRAPSALARVPSAPSVSCAPRPQHRRRAGGHGDHLWRHAGGARARGGGGAAVGPGLPGGLRPSPSGAAACAGRANEPVRCSGGAHIVAARRRHRRRPHRQPTVAAHTMAAPPFRPMCHGCHCRRRRRARASRS